MMAHDEYRERVGGGQPLLVATKLGRRHHLHRFRDFGNILRAIHAGSHYARVQKGTRWIGRNQLKRNTPLGHQQPPQTYAAFPLPFHAYKRHWQ
jgi:hypothetical protein